MNAMPDHGSGQSEGLKPLTAAMFHRKANADEGEHELIGSFFREIGSSLRTVLRELGEGDPKVDVEEVSREELAPLVSPCSWGFRSPDAHFTMRSSYDANFAHALCDYCLGGDGFGSAADDADRPLSKIEKNLCRHVIHKALVDVPDIASRLTQGRASLAAEGNFGDDSDRIESSVASRHLTARFLLNIFGYCGELHLTADLEEVMSALQIGTKADPQVDRKEDRLGFLRLLDLVPIHIEAKLPPQRLDYAELATLRSGRVLHLDAGPDARISLVSNGTTFHLGKLTSNAARVAVALGS